ncbi:MAG: hypothetical protein ACREGC_01285, partial [Minisyncoccia bacterium]
MKKRLSYLLSAIFTIGALVITPAAMALINVGEINSQRAVLAADTTSDSSSTSSTGSSSNDTSKIESENKNIDDRIAKFKTEFKIALTATEKAGVKLHCVAAQTK